MHRPDLDQVTDEVPLRDRRLVACPVAAGVAARPAGLRRRPPGASSPPGRPGASTLSRLVSATSRPPMCHVPRVDRAARRGPASSASVAGSKVGIAGSSVPAFGAAADGAATSRHCRRPARRRRPRPADTGLREGACRRLRPHRLLALDRRRVDLAAPPARRSPGGRCRRATSRRSRRGSPGRASPTWRRAWRRGPEARRRTGAPRASARPAPRRRRARVAVSRPLPTRPAYRSRPPSMTPTTSAPRSRWLPWPGT